MSEFSIHALLAESDDPSVMQEIAQQLFYPRSPCGERRQFDARGFQFICFSIHALLAESDHAPSHNPCRRNISIHALLAESDISNCKLSIYY